MRRKVLLTCLIVGLAGLVAGAATISAFCSTTSSTGNSFAAGTVTLSDNDAGSALLSLTGAKPGDTSTGCILVTYTGSLGANVHLYGAITGGLAPYLTLTITRGTDSSPSFKSCTNFTADPTVYVSGQPAGVVYNGLLSAFPASYASGITDPNASSPETWTTSEAHSYKYVISLNNDNNAQGLSSTASFTWEARNL